MNVVYPCKHAKAKVLKINVAGMYLQDQKDQLFYFCISHEKNCEG